MVKHNPLGFVILKYANASLPDGMGGFGTGLTEQEEAHLANSYVMRAMHQLKEKDPASFRNLEIMVAASGTVRTDWLRTEIPRILSRQTPDHAVEQRLKDPKGVQRPTAGERALQILNTNFKAGDDLFRRECLPCHSLISLKRVENGRIRLINLVSLQGSRPSMTISPIKDE